MSEKLPELFAKTVSDLNKAEAENARLREQVAQLREALEYLLHLIEDREPDFLLEWEWTHKTFPNVQAILEATEDKDE